MNEKKLGKIIREINEVENYSDYMDCLDNIYEFGLDLKIGKKVIKEFYILSVKEFINISDTELRISLRKFLELILNKYLDKKGEM